MALDIEKVFSTFKTYGATFVLILFVPIIYMAYHDYKAWYALGGGGGPHNLLGWSVQALLRPFCSRDVRSTTCYNGLLVEGENSLDTNLPVREGIPPRTGKWTFPHRLTTQTASDTLKKVSLRSFNEAIPC